MNLNRFFTDRLGAQLKNSRWSWGAIDPLNNRVYLRVWQDAMQETATGERIQIARDKPRRRSNGFALVQKGLVLSAPRLIQIQLTFAESRPLIRISLFVLGLSQAKAAIPLPRFVSEFRSTKWLLHELPMAN